LRRVAESVSCQLAHQPNVYTRANKKKRDKDEKGKRDRKRAEITTQKSVVNWLTSQIYIYVYIYVYVYVYTYIYRYIYSDMYIYICIYINVCLYAYVIILLNVFKCLTTCTQMRYYSHVAACCIAVSVRCHLAQ